MNNDYAHENIKQELLIKLNSKESEKLMKRDILKLLMIFYSIIIILLNTYGCQLRAEKPPDKRPTESLMQFDHYHSITEVETFLQAVATRHKDLATLIEIGRSRAQRPIYAVEINNPATGKAHEKPAFYLDGNIHGGEVLSGEGALYVINLLLERYESDADIRELVDTRAFFIIPIVNPDGREISVARGENHRWNIRPFDEDNDGRVDEDPPDDLDGDGRILRMRVEDPKGQWKVSSADERLMVRRSRGETGGTYYKMYSEGIDNDHDGQFNEDIAGGIDVNRNFPSNWHPAQFASGPYPLSEPESHALVEYITSRPNIAAVHTFHTSGGMILRFPTLGDQDWEFPAADIRDYNEIAQRGAEITGYDNYANEKKKIVDRMNPGHGVFNDWASNIFGVLAMTTEMWKQPGGRGQGTLDWNDRELGGKGFINWYPFQHPQLGEVELGGWDRFLLSNAPEPLMAKELERNAQWVLSFAERLPRVVIVDAQAQKSTRQLDLIEIVAQVANTGWMATATEHAEKVLRIAKPVTVILTLENAELAGTNNIVELGVLPGARENGPVEVPVSWLVKVVDSDQPAFAEIIATSEKAGVARRRIDLRNR